MTGRLTVSRVLPAPPERVWPAWTTETGLAAWWWTHLPDTAYEVDARVGGRYRISSPGAGIGVHGEYSSVDEPHCLAATWIWISDGVDGAVEHVRVTLTPNPSGTLLRIDHDGAWTAREPAEAYRQGWGDVIDALEQVLLRAPGSV